MYDIGGGSSYGMGEDEAVRTTFITILKIIQPTRIRTANNANKAAKTGDTANVVFPAAVMMLAGAAVADAFLRFSKPPEIP